MANSYTIIVSILLVFCICQRIAPSALDLNDVGCGPLIDSNLLPITEDSFTATSGNPGIPTLDGTAWRPTVMSVNQSLTVDFGQKVEVSKFSFGGDGNTAVPSPAPTNIILYFSDDGANFNCIKKPLGSCKDWQSAAPPWMLSGAHVSTYDIVPTVFARYFKIDPIEPAPTLANNGAESALRIEFYGCVAANGTRVKCSDGHMEVWIGKAEYPGVTAGSLQLLSPPCKAKDTGRYFYFNTSLHGCGTKHNQTVDHITYWNKAFTPSTPLGINSSVITRYSSLSVPFYCKFSRQGDVSLSYTIKKSVPVWHGSYGNFTFIMDLFYSGRYQRAHGLADYPVPVMINEPLYIQYSVKSTTGNLSVLADSCRATLTKEPYSSPFYTFIEKGCAKDNTMSYVYKPGLTTQRFTINSFRFVHQHPDQVVYLHCRLIVCHRLSYDSRCQQGCYGRRRREVNAEDEEAEDLYLTLKASNRQGGEGNQKVSSTSTATRAGLSTLGGLVVVLLAVIGVFGMRRRIAKKKPTMQLDVVASATNQVFTLDDESVQGHAQSTA